MAQRVRAHLLNLRSATILANANFQFLCIIITKIVDYGYIRSVKSLPK